MTIPPAGIYLWDWFYDLSARIRRVRDGGVDPIPPSEFLAWRLATGNIVYPGEYAILSAMDAVYCSETGKELADYRERTAENAKREADSGKRGRKR